MICGFVASVIAFEIQTSSVYIRGVTLFCMGAKKDRILAKIKFSLNFKAVLSQKMR